MIIYNKKQLCKLPAVEDGIVAFQLVEYVMEFFGTKVSNVLDTKIMEDGRQFVIDGDGFVKAGTEVLL